MTPLALAAVGCTSAALLITELALTRIFSVVMYYHFAFLAISIALFGLSASGVYAYLRRHRLERLATEPLLANRALLHAAATIVALFVLVRLRVGLNYSPHNLALMLTIYALAALPFFTGGLVITLAISRLASRINAVYAADLIGASVGCLALIPLLDRVGAPGVVLIASALACVAAVMFAPAVSRARYAAFAAAIVLVPLVGQVTRVAGFDVVDTKGHRGDRVLFSKWNSFSRIGVYEREHGDWSLSPAYTGRLPETRFMDIDSAASTPILHVAADLSNTQYLRYELTGLAYHLKERRLAAGGLPLAAGGGFKALVIGPGGGRDIATALVFGAGQVDAVEINPIIANDVMRGQFKEFSGAIYDHPNVQVSVDDGRSFVRRSSERYDVIQASLVDTWAATAAGAYTLTENTLYTVEAFDDYLEHLTESGVLSITRWVFDGLRLVSLAQEVCERRGWDDCGTRLVLVRHRNVLTFLMKRTPFSPAEVERLRKTAADLEFTILYAPTLDFDENEEIDGVRTGDYGRLIVSADRHQFYASYPQDIRPTTDDRPFFFHTTKLENQFDVAFGRSMLFGNGLSALLTLMGISTTLVALFVLVPLTLAGDRRPPGWFLWLVYFGALGAGFMLMEVAMLQRFVLLLGHPVYSLTVTLFSLLLGTGLGAALSRRLTDARLPRSAAISLMAIAALGLVAIVTIAPLITWAVPFTRPTRIAVAVATLVPVGMLLGIPMPAGIRLLAAHAPEIVTWAWGINGALSVVGATLAIFIAMNWGFGVTFLIGSSTYLVGLLALLSAIRVRPV
jgi:spermidine synthase